MASAGLDACSLKLELSILHSVDDDHDEMLKIIRDEW